MSAEILEFGKPDEWYITRAENWSRRGELAKSLLYAYMTKENTREAKICRASVLYESGNLSLALKILVDLRADGDRGGDMYALLVKTLDDMTRYRSAAYFMAEGAETGAFPFLGGAAPICRRDYADALSAVRRAYPDNKFDSDLSSVIYVAERTLGGADESLTAEMLLEEHDFAGSEIMFRTAGILYPEKVVPPLADKLIDACKSAMEREERPRHEVLATLAVALASSGRADEARETGELLAELDLPEGDMELVKTVAALLSLGMGDEARYYLDELCAIIPVPSVLLVAAEAELNEGDTDEARDRIARCLTIDPHNMLARYLMKKSGGKRRQRMPFTTRLPDAEAKKMLMRLLSSEAEEDAGFAADATEYFLSCGDTPVAREIIESSAGTRRGRRAFTAYLTDIEGQPALKREILFHRLLAGEKLIPLYSFGERMVSPSEECVRSCGKDEPLHRAYCRALATAAVYCDASLPINAIFCETADALGAAAHGENYEYDCSAALMLLCRAVVQCPGLETSALFEGADKETAARLAAAVKDRVVYDFGEDDA